MKLKVVKVIAKQFDLESRLAFIKRKLMENDDKVLPAWGYYLNHFIRVGLDSILARKRTIGCGSATVALENDIKKQVKCFFDIASDAYHTKKLVFLVEHNTLALAGHLPNSVEIVKMLIDYGADWNVKTMSVDFGPIKHAFKTDENGIVNLILDEDVDAEYLKSSSLLNCALLVLKGTVLEETVELLVKRGADVNAIDKDDFGYSTLNCAIKSENARVVGFLIESGANLNRLDGTGSELEFAIEEGATTDVIKVLLNHGAHPGRDSFTTVIAKGDLEMVKLLLDYGACINGLEPNGWTPIDLATDRGHEKIVELLLDRGAARSNYTLALAIEFARVNVIELLLKRGYDCTGLSAQRTMLSYAVESGKMEIVKLLLDGGACVNEASENGKCPLHYAVKNVKMPLNSYKKDHIVKLLLDRGADINLLYRGTTAVTLAYLGKNYEACRYLVRHLILMRSLNLHVSEANLNDLKATGFLESLQDKCTSEMELLKIEEFDDSNLSLYNLLITKDLDKLAALTRNKNIVNTVKSDDFEEKYPIYGDLIVKNLNKGFLRNKDYSLITRFFNYLSDRDHDKLPKLPLTVVYETFCHFLSFDDIVGLRNL